MTLPRRATDPRSRTRRSGHPPCTPPPPRLAPRVAGTTLPTSPRGHRPRARPAGRPAVARDTPTATTRRAPRRSPSRRPRTRPGSSRPPRSRLRRSRMKQAVQVALRQGLPRCLDDVLRDPDRGPFLFAVGHVDQDTHDGAGPDALVQDADPEVLELHRVELRIVVRQS